MAGLVVVSETVGMLVEVVAEPVVVSLTVGVLVEIVVVG